MDLLEEGDAIDLVEQVLWRRLRRPLDPGLLRFGSPVVDVLHGVIELVLMAAVGPTILRPRSGQPALCQLAKRPA
jgi:hypothetical protein